MSDAVYGVVSVYDHAELLPHFLEHYAQLGVRRMLVSAREESAYEIAQSLAKDYPVRVVYTPSAFFADSDKAAVEAAMLDAETQDPDAYVMHLDLDEFQEYPASLRPY
jgi:UDP-N-acetyl-D-mannosaminuronic acid transferase (WecB/TagA/CpsF family)